MENQGKRMEAIRQEFQDILTECFEISCGEGWAELIYDGLKEIRDNHPDVIVYQIKEKYGYLRFNMQWERQETWDIIRHIEEKSGNVCEFTGQEGTRRKVNNWWKTTCDEIYQRALRNNTWIGDYNEEGCVSR